MMNKKHYIYIIITALASSLVFIAVSKNDAMLLIKNNSLNVDNNILLLKKKGVRFVNNSDFDSLNSIINKIDISDTSLEVKIFKLYNYLINKDTLEFNKLLNGNKNINTDNIFYLVNMGSILMNFDYYHESLNYYLKADSLYGSNNSIVLLNIGILYSNLNENEKAIDVLTKAIKIDRGSSDLYYVRANSYYNLKELYNAVMDLNTAIDIAKTNPDYYFLRGKVLKESGNILAGNIDIDLAYKYGYAK